MVAMLKADSQRVLVLREEAMVAMAELRQMVAMLNLKAMVAMLKRRMMRLR